MRTERIGNCELVLGDCTEVVQTYSGLHACATDPPYHLSSIVKRFGAENAAPAKSNGETGVYARASTGFMGQTWDGGDVAFRRETWAAIGSALLPGAHLAAFSGTRTYHRMAVAIEDAGFEIRDMLSWMYGTGFPKSHDVSKGIDRSLGAERAKVRVNSADLKNPPNMLGGVHSGQNDRPWRADAMARGYHEKDSDEAATPEANIWQGWGSALKPGLEPIAFGRKPLAGTIAENVLEHGTGALNIDGCRVRDGSETSGERPVYRPNFGNAVFGKGMGGGEHKNTNGRWPANVITDGSLEVYATFPKAARDAIRFFYSAKASKEEREFGLEGMPTKRGGMVSNTSGQHLTRRDGGEPGERANHHPTVKPTALMAWLCRLITPPGGAILDPFMGSGSTGIAAVREGFRFVGIEQSPEYFDIACRRIEAAVRERESGVFGNHSPESAA